MSVNKPNKDTVGKEKTEFKYQSVAYKILSVQKEIPLVSHTVGKGNWGHSRDEQCDLSKTMKRPGAEVWHGFLDQSATHPWKCPQGTQRIGVSPVLPLSSNKDANARYFVGLNLKLQSSSVSYCKITLANKVHKYPFKSLIFISPFFSRSNLTLTALFHRSLWYLRWPAEPLVFWDVTLRWDVYHVVIIKYILSS